MKMNLNLKMNQKLVMTPMLQQAIKLLPLARLELAQLVRQEIIDNPVLEEILDDDVDSLDERKKDDNDEDYDYENSQDSQEQEIDWDSYFQNNIDQGMSAESLAEKPSIEATYKKEISLSDHLYWQLNLTIDSDWDKFIGSCIIGNIQKDGYLCKEAELSEIAKMCQTDETNVERVLKIIQKFEPLGVAARSLRECLMLQAQDLPKRNSLVEELIENYLDRLEDRYLPKVARELKITLEEVLDALHIIREFSPKPGIDFNAEAWLAEGHKPRDVDYVRPDLVVIKNKEGYDVSQLINAIKAFKARFGVEVVLEPGAGLVVNTGELYASVLALHWNEVDLAILDASASTHPSSWASSISRSASSAKSTALNSSSGSQISMAAWGKRANHSGESLPVPMSMPRKTCMASAEMIRGFQRSAKSSSPLLCCTPSRSPPPRASRGQNAPNF